jgi:hypothetical protein
MMRCVYILFQSAVYSAMKLVFLYIRVLRHYVLYDNDIFCMVHAINVCCDLTMMCTLRYIHYHVGINDCDVDDSCIMLIHRTLHDHVVHSFMSH